MIPGCLEVAPAQLQLRKEPAVARSFQQASQEESSEAGDGPTVGGMLFTGVSGLYFGARPMLPMCRLAGTTNFPRME